MSTIPERVAAGAAFLDEHDPDWWRADVERAIGLDTLNLALGRTCILGQRCPLEIRDPHRRSNFHMQAARLSAIALGDMDAIDKWAARLGFQVRPLRDRDDALASIGEYNALTAEWKRVISERRAAA